MPILLQLLLRLGAFAGGSMGTNFALKKLLGSGPGLAAKQLGAKALSTAPAQAVGKGAEALRGVLPGFTKKAVPTLAGIGGLGAGVLGVAGGLAADTAVSGLFDHDDGQDVTEFRNNVPPFMLPDQQNALQQIQRDAQLREVLELMGVDIEQLNSLAPRRLI